MIRLFRGTLVVPSALLFFACAASAGPEARLELWSQQGDYIGQGQVFDITYTPSNSNFFDAYSYADIMGRADWAVFMLGTVTGGADNTYANLTFSTQKIDTYLAPGEYLDAERAPFASPGHPGLDVSFQNRGCNTLTGSFNILQASFGAGGVVDSFRATFSQNCEGGPAALIGRFSYSSVAPAIPEPSTYALMLTGLAAVGFVARRRRA